MYYSIPTLQDIPRKQFENQFCLPPNHPIFNDKNKVFFICGIESTLNWSYDYISFRNELETRSGVGNFQYYIPVAIKELKNYTNIDKLYGFYLERKA